MSILVTGSAGFIGFHLSKELLKKGINVIGYDNLNDYYDKGLKEARHQELIKISSELSSEFSFVKGNLEDRQLLTDTFKAYKPEKVVNLAGQAGVRYSIENPSSYIDSNIVGFGNILEECRNNHITHLVYASSSSVYGGNSNMPFSEKHGVDHPVSLYAASKKANELMAHTYSHLYGLPCTGLRFFTVYGPWGRPDMAPMIFAKAILNNEPIKIFNNGNMIRDFTYIDDIVESLVRVINKTATSDNDFDKLDPNPSTSWSPHRVFNIGNSNPVELMEFISAIEDSIGSKANKNYMPMQPGDVIATSADTKLLEEWIDFKPKTSIHVGVKKFVEWYREFYQI